MSRRQEAMCLALACATLYLTGLGDVSFYTRGEPREGLVVREMLRTGQWLVPLRPEGETARKPPLYYWVAAVALSILPEHPELALRLPSAAFATAAVMGTWAATRAIVGPAAALPAGLVLATGFEWSRAAVSARVDMALTAGLTLLVLSWMCLLAERPGPFRWLALAGATIATLGKGPVALILPGLTVVVLAAVQRDRRLPFRLHAPLVLGGAALLAGLWYVAAYLRQGSAFLDVVARENWLRFVDTDDAKTGHAHDPLYLLAVGLVGFLPWTPLIPLVVQKARSAVGRFAVAWMATGVVFFSLAAAKRSVYLLPLFPALAMLVAHGATNDRARAGRGERLARAASWLYVPSAFLLAAVAGAYALGVDPSAPLQPWLRRDDVYGAQALADAARSAGGRLAALGLGTAIGGLVIARALRAADWRRLVLVVAVVTIAWTSAFSTLLHPGIARQRSFEGFMAHVDRLVPGDATLLATYPPDPGVRFYAPRPLAPWRARAAAAGSWVLLWEDEWRRLRDETGRSLDPLAVSDAMRPGRGHLVLVQAPATVRIEPAAPAATERPAEGDGRGSLRTGSSRP